MKKLLICFFVSSVYLFCISAVAQQAGAPDASKESSYSPVRFHKRLSSAEKEHILEGPFTVMASTEAMPANVKQAFAEITGEPSFALANPGQKYQVTDFISDPRLPDRRLLFAGVKGDEWFIHYERGGRGHSYSVIVFKVTTPYRLQFLWGGAGANGAKHIDELRKMIAAGRFLDDLPNYW